MNREVGASKVQLIYKKLEEERRRNSCVHLPLSNKRRTVCRYIKKGPS